MAREQFQSPDSARNPDKILSRTRNLETMESLLSPRFRSAAALAGWDEETLLLATTIIEDTPERDSKRKRCSNQPLKTPTPISRRKRRFHQQNPSPINVRIIRLDEEENVKYRKENKDREAEEKDKKGGDVSMQDEVCAPSSLVFPCLDKLREELSCAICLEICFEPSTTTCGHSFCKKCLKYAADKCGRRCPKCRQLISNGRSCTVNTVLWNTIQLLFPKEVEERKRTTQNAREAAKQSTKGSCSSNGIVHQSNISGRNNSRRGTAAAVGGSDSRPGGGEVVVVGGDASGSGWRRTSRRLPPNQDEDAALAFRLQRQEFREAFRQLHDGGDDDSRPHDHEPAWSLYNARSNLRAMASRAMELRVRRGRGRPI